jgi:hypothetical protein
MAVEKASPLGRTWASHSGVSEAWRRENARVANSAHAISVRQGRSGSKSRDSHKESATVRDGSMQCVRRAGARADRGPYACQFSY